MTVAVLPSPGVSLTAHDAHGFVHSSDALHVIALLLTLHCRDSKPSLVFFQPVVLSFKAWKNDMELLHFDASSSLSRIFSVICERLGPRKPRLVPPQHDQSRRCGVRSEDCSSPSSVSRMSLLVATVTRCPRPNRAPSSSSASSSNERLISLKEVSRRGSDGGVLFSFRLRTRRRARYLWAPGRRNVVRWEG